MHVMMTKEQFDELKKKGSNSEGKAAESKDKGSEGKTASDSKNKGKERFAKIVFKEEDDTHGVIETDDVDINYFYNSSEGRLNFGPSKRKTLAAYCAGDNIIGTYIMDILSQTPSSESKSGSGASGAVKDGGSEGEEKKVSEQEQPVS